jgi:hypothetical protein
MLFALPFLGVAVVTGGLAVRELSNVREASHWMEVPALILEAELEEHHGDSTTYRAVARYRYEVDGASFESTRLGWSSGRDNIGTWQQDRHRELVRARDEGRTLPARVNPAHPEEAILFPALRVGLVFFYGVFVLTFGGGSLAMLVAGLRLRRRQRLLDAAPPEAPWMARADWAAGLITSASRQQAAFAVLFATFWNLIAWPIVLLNGGDILRRGGGALMAFLFPVVGLALAAWALREIRAAQRYGKAVFQMAAVPGVLGGRLAGLIRLPDTARPEAGFLITLRCVRSYRSGKHSRTEVLWTNERRLDVESLPLVDVGHALPVLFALPYDQPASGAWDGRGSIAWHLHVKGQQPGVDVDLMFEVPVFKTAESRPDFVLDERPIEAFEAKA